MAIFLRSADLGRFFNPLILLAELRAALAAEPSGSGARGELPGVPAFSVRVGHELHLHDAASGEVLAVMEGERLFAMRDAVLAALAVDALARPEATRVALVGAGASAGLILKSIRLVRSLAQLRVFDPELVSSHTLAGRLFHELSLPARAFESLEEALQDADLVLVSTPGLLERGVSPGAHVHLAAAQPPPANAKVFSEEALRPVLRGAAPGRSHEGEVTVFAPQGLSSLDLVAAWHVYQVAKDDDSLPRVQLGA